MTVLNFSTQQTWLKVFACSIPEAIDYIYVRKTDMQTLMPSSVQSTGNFRRLSLSNQEEEEGGEEGGGAEEGGEEEGEEEAEEEGKEEEGKATFS